MRGAISETHRDQARAAIVFTAAGIDACLRTLLRDALPTLLLTEGLAHGAFIKHVRDKRLKGELLPGTLECRPTEEDGLADQELCKGYLSRWAGAFGYGRQAA